MFIFFFFFFQAEDGIRDTSVTGVQTCALPISQKSGGYIRLGDVAGTITADVRGDKAFGSYVSTAGGIAFRIAHDRGGIADDQFNLTSFELLNNAQPAPIGVYTGTNTFTIADLW